MALAFSVWVIVQYNLSRGGFQLQESMPLLPALGIQYALAVDGMAVTMVVLTGHYFLRGAGFLGSEGAAAGIFRHAPDFGHRCFRGLHFAGPFSFLSILRIRGPAHVPSDRDMGNGARNIRP